MAQLPVPLRARQRQSFSLEWLATCVRGLDPATRALLDLSVRRGVRDDAMAPTLQTDPFHLAWRRARALEALARAVAAEEADPPPLTEVRSALMRLPDDVWLVGAAALPAPSSTRADIVPADEARPGVIARLDAYASAAPTLREALRGVGRALGRKAVRVVVWRRLSAHHPSG